MPKNPTAAHTLGIARGELGYVERATNRTKYGKAYGLDANPWCDMFVTWVLTKAGLDLSPKRGLQSYRSAYTPAGANIWRNLGSWHTDPRPGDIAYFDFPGDGVDRISHVGFVERILSNGDVVTIEGNTSSGNAGDQRNGGGVYRRTRARSLIVGFGRPPYSDSPKEPRKVTRRKATKAKRKGVELLRRGDRGEAVKTWQRQLTHVARIRVRIDGAFGPKTESATRLFQALRGIKQDGIVGPATRREMAALYQHGVKKGSAA